MIGLRHRELNRDAMALQGLRASLFLCSVCLLREGEDRGVSAYTQRREEEQPVLKDVTDVTPSRGSEKRRFYRFQEINTGLRRFRMCFSERPGDNLFGAFQHKDGPSARISRLRLRWHLALASR